MKHILPIILILLLALAFVSCHHGERQTLRSALQMAYAAPLTSSLRHPKILIKEFSYFLMPCHQHGLRINLLV